MAGYKAEHIRIYIALRQEENEYKAKLKVIRELIGAHKLRNDSIVEAKRKLAVAVQNEKIEDELVALETWLLCDSSAHASYVLSQFSAQRIRALVLRCLIRLAPVVGDVSIQQARERKEDLLSAINECRLRMIK